MSKEPHSTAPKANQELLQRAVIDPSIIVTRTEYMHAIYAENTTEETIANAMAAQKRFDLLGTRVRKDAIFFSSSEGNHSPAPEKHEIKTRKAAFDEELRLLLEHTTATFIARTAIQEILLPPTSESEKFPNVLTLYDTLTIIFQQIARRRGYPPINTQSTPPQPHPRQQARRIMLRQLDGDMEQERLTATMYHLWTNQLTVDKHTAIQRFNEHCVKNYLKSIVSTIMRILTRKKNREHLQEGPITLAERQINRLYDTMVGLIERLQSAPHIPLFEHLVSLSPPEAVAPHHPKK